MLLFSRVLQAVGCAALTLGAGILFGTGVGICVGGALAVTAGAVLEREAS